MKKTIFAILAVACYTVSQAQVMTPETLWSLGRVSGLGVSEDGSNVLYRATYYDAAQNSRSSKMYAIPLSGGAATEVKQTDKYLADDSFNKDASYRLQTQEVKIQKVFGTEHYPDLDKANAKIYDDLSYRHWDTWEDGKYSHLILQKMDNRLVAEEIDLMEGKPYDCPQMPFGGDEDHTWHPDGNSLVYVTKTKSGAEYAKSTNTDIFTYDIASKKTTNVTEGMMGYDTHPIFSSTGTLAWLSMARDGYESDKNDIYVLLDDQRINLTKDWDGTVNTFTWASSNDKIYFTAPVKGTVQLFEIDVDLKGKKVNAPIQLTEGKFDLRGFVGESDGKLVLSRTDMNHAVELYTYDIKSKNLDQLTHVNDDIYSGLTLSNTEERWVTTTDGKQMLVWVIYPPNFDPNEQYPTLLYCQGGPQGALSQFYSFRWNFQLMAANGYIVVAPNRRGMPGHGVAWNEEISKDWGNQAMKDYLSAIDDVAKESYVDKNRLGCVGASFGGYSAFMLAGMHEGRFKTFIAHDGVFNLKSMYGTTEEMWFVNWDFGGPYWEKDNAAAQKTYAEFDPSNFVDKWDTPMLVVQGEIDYRVPIGQSLEAFQALRLQGIKSRLLLFPEENHWVLTPQNGILWQREFFKWLNETL